MAISRRFISTINDPSFLNDPVPIRTFGNSFHQIDNIYIDKGDVPITTAHSDFEYKGGPDDIFDIKRDSNTFQLSRTVLKSSLESLKTKSSVFIRDLDPYHTELFKSIIEAMKFLQTTQPVYEIVVADIRSVFSDVPHIKPGTVGAAFIGCFNDDKFPGPLGCSPKCVSSIQPADDTPGHSNCDDLVLIYSDSHFSPLNDKHSSHAYIYLENNFNTFTSQNISELREAGVTNVSLIYGNPDGSYREITSPQSLESLPATTTEENSSSAAGATAIIILIIVIIIILLLFAFYQPFNSYW